MQIPDEIRKCVVFVCYNTENGMRLAGTAFFLEVPIENSKLVVPYLITARHVIDAIRDKSIDQKVFFRINLISAGTRFIRTSTDEWLFHPEDMSVDVAVLATPLPHDQYDYLNLPLSMAATQEIIEKENIGLGDDVFLTGLFSNHYGSQRNVPIIRVGNIASMPEEKVQTSFGDIDAYLVEARSIGGLSGSPVFAYTGGMRRRGGSLSIAGGPIFYWLGLMHGHFEQSQLEIDNLEQDSLMNLQINMGIAIVVPVWKVLEVINQEALIEARKLILKKEGQVPGPDSQN